MAVDLYVYNGTNHYFDTTATFAEFLVHAGKVVPPGSQAHLLYPDQPTASAVAAHHESFGMVNYANLPSTMTVATLAHNPSPMSVGGKQPPIV